MFEGGLSLSMLLEDHACCESSTRNESKVTQETQRIRDLACRKVSTHTQQLATARETVRASRQAIRKNAWLGIQAGSSTAQRPRFPCQSLHTVSSNRLSVQSSSYAISFQQSEICSTVALFSALNSARLARQSDQLGACYLH